MENEEKEELTELEKWTLAVLIGLLAFIVTHAITFRFSNGVLGYVGLKTLSPNGSATPLGWTLHIVAFIVILRILLR